MNSPEYDAKKLLLSFLTPFLILCAGAPVWSFQISKSSGSLSAMKGSVPITIHGHVTDASGNPLAGVMLSVKWTERTTVTSQTGEFTLENVLEKDTIEVDHAGYQHYQFTGQKSIANYFIMLKPAAKGATSRPSSEVEPRTKPPRNGGETMDITGKIYDDKGVGLAGAFLVVKDRSQGGSANEKGEFNLPQVPINSTIVVTHVSFFSEEFTVKKSESNYQLALRKNTMMLDELVIVGIGPPSHGSRNRIVSQPTGDGFVVVEQNPEFPGGVQALYKYLAENIQYPAEASQSNVMGKIFVSFTVNENGSIRRPQIVKGLGFGIDEEVLRVVLNMPKWNPAKQNGKPVSKEFALPISFNLQ